VHAGSWWGSLGAGHRLEDRGVNGRIILKWILERWVGKHELYGSGSGQGQVVGCYECGNKPSGSIKCGGFLH
jgi:hypothetical protein